MRLRFLALILLGSVAAACGSEPIVPVDATPDADLRDALDLQAPDTHITVKPAALTNHPPTTFEFEGTDNAAPIFTFKCKIDTGAEAFCSSPKMYTGLTNGSHLFAVRAIDTSGNEDPTPDTYSWFIDTMPPDTQILTGPPDPDNSASATFTFDAPGESNEVFLCGLDGAVLAPCTSPTDLINLSDGNHIFRVQAKDAAGNFDSSPASYNWAIDSATPDTAIDTGPAGTVNTGAATFTFSSPNAGADATFSCHLDAAPFGPCTSPRNFAGLADGAHTFEVRAADMLGNTDPTPARRTWTIDSTGPISSITVRPENPSGETMPSFQFTANEPATFECQIDGVVAFQPCTSPFAAPLLSGGPKAFRVRATDTIGNHGPEAIYEWVIDSTGPSVTITSGPNGPSGSSTALFNWLSSEPATFCYRFSGDANDTCTVALAGSGTVTRNGIMEGPQSFTITATDALGNPGTTLVRNFVVDTTGPTVMIMAGPMNTVGTISNNFTFTSGEVATFCWRVDMGDELCTPLPGAVSSTVSISALDGMHSLSVVARDVLGNRTAVPATRSWTVDTVRPTTTITMGPVANSIVDAATATVVMTSSEAASICWKVNAGAETCSANGQMMFQADLMALPQGDILFTARAQDAVGSGQPVTRRWTVDTMRPTVTINSGPVMGSTTGLGNASFSITASEPAQICWQFNALPQVCSPVGVTDFSPSAAGLPDGNTSFTVFAKDAIGPGPMASRSWTIDSVRPTVTITGGPADGSAQGSNIATFNVTASESSTICWRFNGGLEACSAGPVMMANAMSAALADGGTSFEVYAADAIGNGLSVIRNWSIDTARPTISITNGPAANSTVSSSTASFTLVASERARICWQFNGAAAVCSNPGSSTATATATGLPDGPTTFSVTGADAVGAGVATTRNWTIDTVRPTVSITAGAANGARLNNADQTFTVASTESATICWQLDGAAPQCTGAPVMSTNIMLMALPQGDHTLSITGADNFGAGATLTRIFTIDTVRPTVTITSGPTEGSTANSTTAAFNLVASEASTICWKFDGGAETCSGAGSSTALASAVGLAQLAHTIDVRASDLTPPAGFGATTTVHWTVDTARPTANIMIGPAQGSTQGSKFAAFTVTSTEMSTICWRFSTPLVTGPQLCSNAGVNTVNFTSLPLGEGPQVLAVEARDGVGPGPTVLRSWTVDTIRPTVSITSGPGQLDLVGNSTATFQLSATEPSIICWHFNAFGQQCTPTRVTTATATRMNLPDGLTTFTATATDLVGDGLPVNRTWTIDTTPPSVMISTPPVNGGFTNLVNQNFNFTTVEPTKICWILDNNIPGKTCSAPHVMMFSASFVNLAVGTHTLHVDVTDDISNAGAADVTWTIDTTPPVLTISSPPAEGSVINTADATFTLTTNEPAMICWKLDGGMETCSVANDVTTFPAVLSMLSDAAHTLDARAVDRATNETTAARHWTVDTTAPTITTTAPPANGVDDTNPTINVTITTDELAKICWILDGGAQTCNPAPPAPLVNMLVTGNQPVNTGMHLLVIQATDGPGNVRTKNIAWTRNLAGKPSAPTSAGYNPATSFAADGPISVWVRDPGLAGGEIMAMAGQGARCSLRGVQAIIGLECSVGGQMMAPAYGALGSLARSDGRWHLVTITFTSEGAELRVDGLTSDRTGAVTGGLASRLMAPALGQSTYVVQGLAGGLPVNPIQPRTAARASARLMVK